MLAIHIKDGGFAKVYLIRQGKPSKKPHKKHNKAIESFQTAKVIKNNIQWRRLKVVSNYSNYRIKLNAAILRKPVLVITSRY